MEANGHGALGQLTAAADAIAASPLPLTDDGAREFLEAHPIDAVFRLLSGSDVDKHAVEVISGALNKVLGTSYGTSMLPAAVGYAEAALGSQEPRLRRLGAAQLGRLLLLPSADVTQRHGAAGALVGALEDPDTGVASEAAAALSRYGASSPPTSLAELLDQTTPAGKGLAALAAGSGTATQRHRAYALLIEAAGASPAAATLLRESGIISRLVGELDPSDPLSSLAALQLLQQLAEAAGPPTARALVQALAPHIPALTADPSTASGALALAAQLVGRTAELPSEEHHPPHADANGAAANGGGAMDVDGAAAAEAAAGQLLGHLAAVLDDSGDAGPQEEVDALDAAGQLALTPAGAQLLAAGPVPGLLPLIASRALGRVGGGAPEVRVAALHALAAAAGGERAGEARDRGAALLPTAAAEDALRSAVYSGAVARGWAGSPAEAVLALLQQPFNELRSALYRCVVALALRSWFAADVANTSALLSRLCDPRSESGGMCQWRHAAVNALLATASEAAAGAEGGEGSARLETHRPALVAALGQLRAAAAAGPYGAAGAGGGAASHDQHFVANRPR